MAPDRSTVDPAVRVDVADGAGVRTKRRILYGATTVVLVGVLGVAVVDGLGAVDVYGVDTGHARGTGGGFELDVRYATVSRPALATPFEITVRRPGGFDGPVILAVASDYLSMWDENGLDPQPSSETSTRDTLIWEIEPPDEGDVLVVDLDARIEPAVQRGKAGRVSVLDDEGAEVVAVEFSTRILP